MLSSIDKISGAKRKENLTNHAEDARISKKLATAEREIEVDVDLADAVAREPDRSRLREVFREFELRDPLRRLEEALGDDEEAAPRERPEERIKVRAREVSVGDLAKVLEDAAARSGEPEPLTLAAEHPVPPEDELPGVSEDLRPASLRRLSR